MTGKSALVGALGASALLLASCGEAKETAPPAVKAAVGDRLTVTPQTVADYKPVAAVVTTRDMGEARARIGGTLVRLSVKEGDLVRQGQQIGDVRDDRLSLETRAYDAQVSAAAAEAGRAQADLTRTKELYAHGVYAKARLDQAESAAKAAAGNLASAKAQRAASAELVSQGAVIAPASGRVLRADTPVGSVVTSGQAIATITAGPPVIRLELPEAQARALAVGSPVELNAEDLRGAANRGAVVQVYPAVTGGQVVADVTAPNLDQNLVGQRVRARIQVGQRAAFVVPARYVSTRYGVDYVRLLRRDGTASDAPVQTAPGPAPGEVEIISGLTSGDVLVPAGPAR